MDEREFKAWLSEQPQETCILIATRAALRVFPLVLTSENSSVDISTLVLMTARATLTSGVAAKMPTPEVKAVARNALSANTGLAVGSAFSAITVSAAASAAAAARVVLADSAFAAEAAYAMDTETAVRNNYAAEILDATIPVA